MIRLPAFSASHCPLYISTTKPLKAIDGNLSVLKSKRIPCLETQKVVALWSLKGLRTKQVKATGEAIRLNPKYADAWYNKGVMLYERGKYD